MSTLLSSRDSSNLTLPTIPAYSDDVEWVTAYLVQRMLSHPSWVYAWLLWIAIGGIFIALTLMHWAGFRGGYIGALWSKWALRRRTWRKKHSLAAAAKSGQPHRQPMSLPSNAQILTVCAMFVGVLALTFAGPDYLAPQSQLWNYQNYPIQSLRKRSYDVSDFTYLQPQFTIWKGWWTTGGRTGLMAFSLFPLVIIFALKAPPFAILSSRYFLQLGFDKLAFLHRWCGFLIWLLATLHTAFWSVQLGLDHRPSTGRMGYVYAWQYEKFIFAWIAYGCFTLLMICSLPAIRRHHYEAFYFLHVLFVPLTLIFSALHHPPLAWWCWTALALWVAERSYRLTWWLNTNGYLGGTAHAAGHATGSPKRSAAQVPPDTLPMHALGQPHAVSKLPTLPRIDPNARAPGVSLAGSVYSPPPGFAHAELMPGKTVRLRIVTPGFLSWAPGQHFLIRIPAISNFTTHPFTVASVCDHQSPDDSGRELVFFIRAKKGWTKDLWDAVSVMSAQGIRYPPGEKLPAGYHPPPKGVLMRAFVDGPFGSAARARWHEHSTVLLMVGGSGVSFGLSVLEYVCMCLAGRDGRSLGARSGGYGMPRFKIERVRFVWIVREFGHVHWCAHYLRRCMEMVPPEELQIDIFVTNIKPLKGISPKSAVPSDLLAPPLPQFAREGMATTARSEKGHSPTSSISSVETEEVDDDVDLSYYESDMANEERGELGHDEHVLDLTNFEDEDDTAMPGEDQLNQAVKEEGRARRSFIRRSMAIFGKGEVPKQEPGFRSSLYGLATRSSVYGPAITTSQYGSGVRGSMYGVGARSSMRLLDDAPSSDAMRALAPPAEASTSRVQLSPIAPSPLSATTISAPTSAAPLLGDRDRDPPRFTFPPEPPSPSPGKRASFAGSRADSPRPESTWSHWSDAHSLAALVSEAAAQEQVRLELDEEEVLDISVVAERVRPGRPVFQRILADEVERSKGSVIVGCCGPTSLNAVVRKNIAAQINPARIRQGDYRGQISLVAEDFGY